MEFWDSDYQLVILDIMLPQKNGYEVLQKIKEKSFVPVLMLTARDSEGGQGIRSADGSGRLFDKTVFRQRTPCQSILPFAAVHPFQYGGYPAEAYFCWQTGNKYIRARDPERRPAA